MSKKTEGQTIELLDHCVTRTTIKCESCGHKDVTDADAMDSIDGLYEYGWRVLNEKCLCGKCAKKAKK